MMACSWRQWGPLQQVLRFQIWCHTVLPCELSIRGCSFHFYSNGKSLASIPLTLGNPEEIPCHPTKAMNPSSVPSPQTNFNLLSNGCFVYFSCRHDSWQETSAWQQQHITTSLERSLWTHSHTLFPSHCTESHMTFEMFLSYIRFFAWREIGRKWFI